jgi:hypothetical protein
MPLILKGRVNCVKRTGALSPMFLIVTSVLIWPEIGGRVIEKL